MTDLAAEAAARSDTGARNSASLAALERVLLAVLGVLLALSLHRVFVANVNWDEFLYLSHVHAYLAETLSRRLQTAYVHLFAWLAAVPGTEVDQVVAARLVVWSVQLATLGLLYQLLRAVASRPAALFALFLYLAFGYVADHGTSFRADPFCALLLVAALVLVFRPEAWLRRWAAAGTLAALSGLVSIKTAIYLPVFAVLLLALALERGPRRAVSAGLTFALALAALFAVLYALHDRSLAPPPELAAAAYVERAGAKTIMWDTLVPRLPYLVGALGRDPVLFVLLLFGLVGAFGRLLRGPARAGALRLLALALPLGSIAVYRNAFPYFYVFALPPAMALVALAAERLRADHAAGRVPLRPALAWAALAVALLLPFGATLADHARLLPDRTLAQRAVLAEVHRIFPEPVTYIDRNGMVASFPKVGLFMSTWGMEGYRAAGRPVMARILREARPPLLVANHPALYLADPEVPARIPETYRLLPADYTALRANFLHHWGPLYVAGKAFDLGLAGAARDFEILVAGVYRLEAAGPVILDGVPLRPGETVALAAGRHEIAASGPALRAVLRWAAVPAPPAAPPPEQPIYDGF